jgi:hypothetical protein
VSLLTTCDTTADGRDSVQDPRRTHLLSVWRFAGDDATTQFDDEIASLQSRTQFNLTTVMRNFAANAGSSTRPAIFHNFRLNGLPEFAGAIEKHLGKRIWQEDSE